MNVYMVHLEENLAVDVNVIADTPEEAERITRVLWDNNHFDNDLRLIEQKITVDSTPIEDFDFSIVSSDDEELF